MNETKLNVVWEMNRLREYLNQPEECDHYFTCDEEDCGVVRQYCLTCNELLNVTTIEMEDEQ
jgi:hypothetical protein